jgi:hypothetical protein
MRAPEWLMFRVFPGDSLVSPERSFHLTIMGSSNPCLSLCLFSDFDISDLQKALSVSKRRLSMAGGGTIMTAGTRLSSYHAAPKIQSAHSLILTKKETYSIRKSLYSTAVGMLR